MLSPRSFLREEAASGVVLAAATVVALAWANSPFRDGYHDLRHATHAWVAEGLMTVFFLVVGMEIRREMSDRRAATLPTIAAVGGMVVPALVFVALNLGGDALRGWAIPSATDIAFAIGVVTLLGDRVPPAARLFLLALAVVDDVLAIAVIALFYGTGVEVVPALLAVTALAAYAAAARRGLPWPLSILLAAAVWYATWRSGVHATIAGVAVGLATPPGEAEARLHPWSAFVVLPLFALVSAGVPLSADAAGSRVAWGVALGLAAGKPLGITLAALLAVRLGIARLPDGVGWRTLTGVAAVAGVGFTVALFVTTLAYGESAHAREATLGIVMGSVVAGTAGALLLSRRPPRPPATAGAGPSRAGAPGRP